MRPTILSCTSTFLLTMFAASGFASAAPASFTADHAQLLCGEAGQQPATWSGACKDGLADGAGVATWTRGATSFEYQGTVVRGEATDGATLMIGATTYIGAFHHFAPQGQGFLKFPNNAMYEGNIDHGKYNGAGIFQDVDRSRYEGEWVNGMREGQGRATFALGGSYDGHWHHNRFDGQGTIVYVGGRTYSGQFKDGRLAGAPPLAAIDVQKFSIKNTENTTGSLIPQETATSPVSGGRWADLSDDERRIVKSRYRALEEGDEPPYPIQGLRPLVAGLAKVGYVDASFEGLVRMNVLVDANGKPKSVTAVNKMPPEVMQYMGRLLMITSYKPAVCHGQPCEMLFPVVMRFDHKL